MRINRVAYRCLFVCLGIILMTINQLSLANQTVKKRVPAEWEPQAATWLQWPGRYEQVYEAAFAAMAEVITTLSVTSYPL